MTNIFLTVVGVIAALAGAAGPVRVTLSGAGRPPPPRPLGAVPRVDPGAGTRHPAGRRFHRRAENLPHDLQRRPSPVSRPGTRLGFFTHMGTQFSITAFTLMGGAPYLTTAHPARAPTPIPSAGPGRPHKHLSAIDP